MARLASVTIALIAVTAACSVDSYYPEARIDVAASPTVQAEVLEATKSFGERNGFTVSFTDQLPKQGRPVSQVDLQRNDGVMMTLDNFMDEGSLTATFYAKQPDADWRLTKSQWLEVVEDVIGGRGAITVVAVEGQKPTSNP